MKFKKLLVFCCLCGLVGCKVGPDYQVPETSVPEQYSEDFGTHTFSILDEDLVEWWTIFNDRFLDELLAESLVGSFDYRIALEKVFQARDQYWIQFTQLLPELDSDGSATRFRSSRSFASLANTTGSPFDNFFQLGLDAVWELDLFGKYRRSADSSYDLWQATYEESQAIKITVLSEVTTTYIKICAFQKRIEMQKEFISFDHEILELSRTKYEAGLASEQEVQALVATYESDQAIVNILTIGLKQSIYSLATLLGRNPETLIVEFQEKRPIINAFGMIVPAGIPGDLLRRRPDIVASERQLASATEQIGIAFAQLFPSVSLAGSSSSYAANPLQGANVGYASDKFDNLFKSASRIWGIGGFVQWPVFDFGKRWAGVKVQKALANQAYLNYQKTVITALEEAEVALMTYFNEQERYMHLKKQVAASQKSLDLIEDLFEAGIADYLQLLQTKQLWVTAVNSFIDSQEALAIDLVNIYKAMGGDW